MWSLLSRLFRRVNWLSFLTFCLFGWTHGSLFSVVNCHLLCRLSPSFFFFSPLALYFPTPFVAFPSRLIIWACFIDLLDLTHFIEYRCAHRLLCPKRQTVLSPLVQVKKCKHKTSWHSHLANPPPLPPKLPPAPLRCPSCSLVLSLQHAFLVKTTSLWYNWKKKKCSYVENFPEFHSCCMFLVIFCLSWLLVSLSGMYTQWLKCITL